MFTDSGLIADQLGQLRQGKPNAKEELVAMLYDRFRQRAHLRLRHERHGHSLATTDLSHEALVRLLRNNELEKAANGNQIFRAFARAMRQVLVDHARRRNSQKRGGGHQREELDDLADELHSNSPVEVLSLDESLTALNSEHPREAEVLEMRFFGGCEMADIAETLSVSLRTVERDSRFGLAWLCDFLSTGEAS